MLEYVPKSKSSPFLGHWEICAVKFNGRFKGLCGYHWVAPQPTCRSHTMTSHEPEVVEVHSTTHYAMEEES